MTASYILIDRASAFALVYDDIAIEFFYNNPSGALHFTASNNDCGVRDFDMERYQLVKHFSFPLPVNTLETLSGHFEYSFASAWHPDGITFSTGNQNKTSRVWDTRHLSQSVAVLKDNLGAIRSICYTSDGKYMAMAEPADFVHIYDVSKGYETEKEVDFFGEISSILFSPDTEALFIGVWDRTYGSHLWYLDSFL
ncbi:hypothetical protein Bca4012_085278 [Brassica carinata]